MTQRQIAAKLGISVATVSMALNNSPRVKNTTKVRVRELAAQTGYRINETARSLSSGKTRTVGVLFPEFDNTFYAQLADELQRQLMGRGYIGIFLSTGPTSDINNYIDMLVARKVDGIISRRLDMEHMVRLNGEKVPVTFYAAPTESNLDTVVVDRGKGVCEAIKHLIGLGHTRIGYVGCQGDFEPRFNAYRHTMMASGLPLDHDWVTSGGSSHETGYRGMLEIFARRNRPTAVIAHCDIVAIGAMCAAFEKNVKVPEQLAIIGYDNIKESRYAAIPLTTVAVDVAELAKALLDTLFERIEGGRSPMPLRTVVSPSLLIRKSCGAQLGKRGGNI